MCVCVCACVRVHPAISIFCMACELVDHKLFALLLSSSALSHTRTHRSDSNLVIAGDSVGTVAVIDLRKGVLLIF